MYKTAFITGASKRIGKAIAEDLASEGWNIIIHYNSSEKDSDLLIINLSHKYPGQHFHKIKANLNIEDEVENLIPNIIKEHGLFSLLINNASIFLAGSILSTESLLLDNHFTINIKAPFLLTRDFGLYCKKGNIINIIDTRITTNNSDYAAYTLSKKSLWELTKMSALELAPHIRVNAIAPGAILPPHNKNKIYLNKVLKETPMEETGGIKSILTDIQFILNNKFLTGQLLFADGAENLKTKY